MKNENEDDRNGDRSLLDASTVLSYKRIASVRRMSKSYTILTTCQSVGILTKT